MPVKSLFSTLDISASGLTANRRWMDAIAENLANAQTTRTETGGPYRRKVVTFTEALQSVALKSTARKQLELPLTITQAHHQENENNEPRALGLRGLSGVEAEIVEDGSEARWVYDPDHPDANEEGYVAYPNVEVVKEMVDLITASRAYEANVTALNSAKAMNRKALDI